ncbi:D-alanine--D-alanine ligase [Corynebacterium sp. TAE3-ERU16]|nr:D-alanine--D-alanine ligase [Corynebacterium sp. TAE3-ERU16]
MTVVTSPVEPSTAPAVGKPVTDRRIRVAVVYGGRSSEHSVSCVTGGAIMSHLDPERYEIVPVGITREGVWTVGESDPRALTISGRTLPEVRLRERLQLSLDPDSRGRLIILDGDRAGQVHAEVDVIFPALHGRFGEDGTVQGMFELSGIPYVGCGVLASACCMDKEYTKKLLAAADLAVAPEIILREHRDLDSAERERLGLPVFVKPAQGGSSIGVSRVTDWSDFPAALDTAFSEDDKVIVESQITGPEVEVGVLQYPDGRLFASVPAQLQGTESGDEGFYGFDTKYLDDAVTPQIPAPLDEATTGEIRRMAVAAFRAVNADGLARVDFFATPDGPVINEVNTLPGFTPISMYPQVLAASGVDYGELLDILVARALH